jgi:AraC family transcriptional regulator of adaptative response / DNA-3-methyladenine glycosylase II
VADRLVADGGLLLRLPFQGPLDWDALLAYLAARAVPGVERVDGSTYRRTIIVDGDPGVLELWPAGPDQLLLRAHLPHWGELLHLVQHARKIASLDFPLAEATAHLAADRRIGPLLRACPGLRPPGTWDPFETGVCVLLGHDLDRTGRLVQVLGTPVPGLAPLGLTYTFPGPSRLATANLDGLGLEAQCARAVRAFAQAVCDDRVRLDGSVGLERLVASLCALDGFCRGTAHELALRLGEADADPLGGPDCWRPWRALAASSAAENLTGLGV